MEDDFIGRQFPTPKGGIITVHECNGMKSNKKKHRCTCSICSNDSELWPVDSMWTQKSNLIAGRVPCGCSHNPKWTKDQNMIRIKRSSAGKFRINGVYSSITLNTKISVECIKCGYKWTPSAGTIIRETTGCSSCSNTIRWTEKSAIEMVEMKGFKFKKLEKWAGANTIVWYICPCGELNSSTVSTISGKKSCTCMKCNGNIPWTESTAEEKLKSMGFSKVSFPEGWNRIYTRVNCICVCGEEYNSGSLGPMINKGVRCQRCSVSGFNPTKPGYLYVVKWQFDGLIGTKYGITNREVETRVKEQQRTALDYGDPPVILKKYYFNLGADAQELERKIKKIFGGNFLTEDELPDGHTETIPYKRTEELIKFIEENI